MRLTIDSPDDVITLFGYRDAYEFAKDLVEGRYDGDAVDTMRIEVGNAAGAIMVRGRVTPDAEVMLRRLWSRPERERLWVCATDVVWHPSTSTLLVKF